MVSSLVFLWGPYKWEQGQSLTFLPACEIPSSCWVVSSSRDMMTCTWAYYSMLCLFWLSSWEACSFLMEGRWIWGTEKIGGRNWVVGRRGMGKCGRDVIYKGRIKNAMLFPICRSKNWLVTHLINTQSR